MQNPRFVAYEDKSNEWRWTFIASNGEPLAVASEGYTHQADCLSAIRLMQSPESAMAKIDLGSATQIEKQVAVKTKAVRKAKRK